ncbi:hypothetical protein [Oleisolibacter albus]|uniref:hypothetical protein n=1 Tax=Oleisolibacter albus TaxID=2171757 RepID=UPI000DF1A643|nr:hypothetical protein [Oleisolibacter albus]
MTKMMLLAGLALAAGLPLTATAQQAGDRQAVLLNGPAPTQEALMAPLDPATERTAVLDGSIDERPSANFYRVLDWVKPNTQVPKPSCAAGLEPRAYATPVTYGMTQAPAAVSGFDTVAEDRGDHWLIRNRMLAGTEGAPATEYGGWVKVSAICAEPATADPARTATGNTDTPG